MVRFNQEQLKYLAEVSNNLGTVFFASMVAPIFTQNKNIFFALSGLLYAFTCWWIGAIILRKKEE